MICEILLDDDQLRGRIYTQGSRVSGQVTCTIIEPWKKVEEISLLFEGEIHTNISRQEDTVHQDVPLFQLRRTLVRGPTILQAKTMVWPFAFEFPADYSHEWKGKRNVDFACEDITLLPPSFKLGRPLFSSPYTTAYVEYKLKVEIYGAGFLNKTVKELYLPFMPTSPNPPSATVMRDNTFERTCWKSRGLREKKHTFKQKIQHIFTSRPELKRPSITFDAQISMPSSMSSGQSSPVTFSAQQTRLRQTDPDTPILKLVSINLSLEQTIFVRVKYGFDVIENGMSKKYLGSADSRPGDLFPIDGEKVFIYHDIGLRGFCHGGVLPGAFKAHTLATTHLLKATIILQHVESGHIFKLQKKFPVDITAPYALLDEHTFVSAPQQAPGISHSPQGWTEQLPAYGDERAVALVDDGKGL